MVDISSYTFGFSKTNNNYSLAPTKRYSSGSPQSQIVYLFSDSSGNYHVGSYNSSNLNVTACPSSSDIWTVNSLSSFNTYKDYFALYGVDTSSWSYDVSVGSYSIYFDAVVSDINSYTYSVDVTNLHFVARDSVSSLCSSVVPNANYYLIAKSTFSVESDSSDNYNDLISAILMIPATIIWLYFL